MGNVHRIRRWFANLPDAEREKIVAEVLSPMGYGGIRTWKKHTTRVRYTSGALSVTMQSRGMRYGRYECGYHKLLVQLCREHRDRVGLSDSDPSRVRTMPAS